MGGWETSNLPTFLQLPVLEDLWDIDMWGSMLQLPGRLLAIAGFQGEIQLSGQVLLKILAAGPKGEE